MQIKMISYFNDHIYKITDNGKDYYLPSVTTKLGIEKKPNLDRWRGDLGNREADLRMYEAAERGTRIHYAWFVYVMGGTVIYNPWQHPNYTDHEIQELKQKSLHFMILTNQDEMLQLWKLQRFFESVNPIVKHAEMMVYDLSLGIAGTLDNALFIEKGTYDVNGSKKLVVPVSGLYIADLKTGKVVDDTVWNQLAPYAKAYQSMGHGEPVGAIVLHTGSTVKSGIPGLSVPLRTADQLEHDFLIYQKISDIWQERNPNFGPDIFEFPSLITRKQK